MNAAQLAVEVAAYIESIGYPFPGKPDIYGTDKYPLVVIWDDRAEVTRVIGCCTSEADLPNALTAAQGWAEALERTGEAPCGTACHAVHPAGFITSEQ